MVDTPTIHWAGKSGTSYQYWIYPIDNELEEKGGNYIFAKETRPHKWRPIYIGQTINLGERLENPEKEKCAIQNDATHIHAHFKENKEDRLAEETDLIQKWTPVCNG